MKRNKPALISGENEPVMSPYIIPRRIKIQWHYWEFLRQQHRSVSYLYSALRGKIEWKPVLKGWALVYVAGILYRTCCLLLSENSNPATDLFDKTCPRFIQSAQLSFLNNTSLHIIVPPNDKMSYLWTLIKSKLN